MVSKKQHLEQLLYDTNSRDGAHTSTRRDFLRNMGVAGLVLVLENPSNPRLAIAQVGWDKLYGPPISMSFEDHKQDALRAGQKFRFLGVTYSNVPVGTGVVATADGSILIVENRRIGGPSIWQDHGNAYVSFYTNLEDIIVEPKQDVKRGQPIAKKGPIGDEAIFYGFGRLFSGEEIRSGIRSMLWIDPNTLGEEGGKLRLYTGKAVADKTPQEARIYYKDLVQKVLDNYKGGDAPEGLKPYLKKAQKSFMLPSEVIKMLKDYNKYFNEGTLEQYSQVHRKMLDPNLPVPVILTHPIKNPILK